MTLRFITPRTYIAIALVYENIYYRYSSSVVILYFIIPRRDIGPPGMETSTLADQNDQRPKVWDIKKSVH